jgi:uncharacterized protein (TIGR04551 family)
VRVLAQVDVLDNTIMGSTPDSLIDQRRPDLRTDRAPVSSLYTTQDPPEIGVNGVVSSIRAKRAWGEVDTEFGSLSFGRMPWQFGRGIAFNNGSCPDCDGGTTVDRILARTQIYGHQFALAWDFGSQGYNAAMVDLGPRPDADSPRGQRDPNGPPLDLSQRDDVLQLMAAVTRIDDERRFQERAAQGELMFNYAAQLVYRKQGNEVYKLQESTQPGAAVTTTQDPPTDPELARSTTLHVDAMVLLPSLWMKLGWKALTVEAEMDGVFGKIDNAGPLVSDQSRDKKLTLRQFGWVVATELRLYKNAFFLGFETGGATGDQAEDPTTYLNYRWKLTKQPANDHLLGDFKFSPEYHIDEILFRRIIGTVTNAIYVKPQMTYWLDLAERRQVGLTGSFVYSLAPEPVSTPGNAKSYGIEMDLGLTYRNPADGFYAGLIWGVLWPLGALDRPNTATAGVEPLWPKKEDASSAQVLRAFLGIRF